MTEPSDAGIIANVSGGFAGYNARVAQLVEHNLAKVGAAGSSPVSRLMNKKKDTRIGILFLVSSPIPGSKFDCLRFTSVRANQRSAGPLAPSRAFFMPENRYFWTVISDRMQKRTPFIETYIRNANIIASYEGSSFLHLFYKTFTSP